MVTNETPEEYEKRLKTLKTTIEVDRWTHEQISIEANELSIKEARRVTRKEVLQRHFWPEKVNA